MLGRKHEGCLTHQPMFLFYTLSKHQKTFGFLMFYLDIKCEYWPEVLNTGCVCMSGNSIGLLKAMASFKIYFMENLYTHVSLDIHQGLTVGLRLVLTPNFIGVRMILDMCTLTRTRIFSLWFFEVYKTFLVRIILYCLKVTAIHSTFNLFVCPWRRQILYCLHLLF